MLDRTEEYAKMAAVERDMWWYRALHRMVEKCLIRHQVGKDAPIVDAGCGTGGLILYLREHGYTNVAGFDASSDAIGFCEQHQLEVSSGSVTTCADLYHPASVSAVVCNDVFCYTEVGEIGVALGQFSRILVPGGLALVNLPALDAFKGIHDTAVGLKRRFSKRDLVGMLQRDTLVCREAVYWPFFVSPLVYGVRLGQRLRLKRDGGTEIVSDVKMPGNLVNSALYGICVAETMLPIPHPWGSSLFVVYQKPLR
jgi:SAM-dependent methyltransferase